MRFSEEFKIKTDGREEWFDPILETDVELFLDPYLIENSDIPEFQNVREKIKSFFENVFEIVIKAKERGDIAVARNILKNILVFPEVSELCLGYSRNTKGSGTSSGFARLIYDAIIDYLVVLEMDYEDFSHIEIFSFFSKNISYDRISDITANIIKEELIKYTQRIIKEEINNLSELPIQKFKFDVERKEWVDGHFKLPYNKYNKKPIILVPKKFLRRSQTFNSDDFSQYLINNSPESLRNSFSITIKKNINKEKIKKILKQHPNFIHRYLEDKYGMAHTKLDPYNVNFDKDFIYYDKIIIPKFLERSPEGEISIKNESELFSFILKMGNHFKWLIEDQGCSELLWREYEDGHWPEKIVRTLFHMVLAKPCSDRNIEISIETKAGIGKVEFKFSQGNHSRTILEIKLADNPLFLHGLEKQLPNYMNAEKIKKGIFLVVYFNEKEKEKVKALYTKIEGINKKHKFEIKILEIDGSKKKYPSQK